MTTQVKLRRQHVTNIANRAIVEYGHAQKNFARKILPDNPTATFQSCENYLSDFGNIHYSALRVLGDKADYLTTSQYKRISAIAKMINEFEQAQCSFIKNI